MRERPAARVLVVDDEPHIVELVRYNLQQEGFDVSVALNGRQALDAVARVRPDLVVLDILMPEVDGFDVCRELRKTGDVAILMLTARDRELDRIVGLELGADDYLTKPFSPRELAARVRAILRRTGQERLAASGSIQSGPIAMNLDTREVRVHGQSVELTAREFDLLSRLIRHPNRVFTRDFLLEHVWGQDYFGSTRTVDMQISRLREKIETVPPPTSFIRTIRGVGYKFKGPAPEEARTA